MNTNMIETEVPLYGLYLWLSDMISDIINNNTVEFEKELKDKTVFKELLKNNACSFKDKPTYKMGTVINDKEVVIYFILGGRGNEASPYIDYVNVLGKGIFVIFLDPLLSCIDFEEPKNEIQRIAKEQLGRSNLFDALTRIASSFNLVCEDTCVYNGTLLSTTSLAAKLRKNPNVFAACVIYKVFKELNENDVPYDYEYLKQISSSDESYKKLALNGIFNVENIKV